MIKRVGDRHTYADMRALFLNWLKTSKLGNPHDGRDLDYFILDSFGYTPEDRSHEAVWAKAQEFISEQDGKFDWLFNDNGFTLFKAYLARRAEGLRGIDE